MKDEFLAVLAHEVRNPLAAISNASKLLEYAGSDAESLAWSKEVIARQVKQLTRLVEDLLDVSRIRTGKVDLRIAPMDAAKVVREAAEVVRPAIEAKRHELRIAIDAESLPVEGDQARLEQALVNLLTNAAKYTDPGGQITLSAGIEGSEVVIRVRDNGLGIPPDQLARVFELFSQVDATLDRSQGGLGIGLSLVSAWSSSMVEASRSRAKVADTAANSRSGSPCKRRVPHNEQRDGEASRLGPCPVRGPAGAVPAEPLRCAQGSGPERLRRHVSPARSGPRRRRGVAARRPAEPRTAAVPRKIAVCRGHPRPSLLA